MPPSLINIFKEIQMDLGKSMPANGDLTRWAQQGVLLLNATLTVREHQANSHQKLGWNQFTDAAIKALNRDREHIVYLLWGGYARSKAALIDSSKNLVLQSVHPSPLSANRGGWFGNHHFSRCNEYLQQQGETPSPAFVYGGRPGKVGRHQRAAQEPAGPGRKRQREVHPGRNRHGTRKPEQEAGVHHEILLRTAIEQRCMANSPGREQVLQRYRKDAGRLPTHLLPDGYRPITDDRPDGCGRIHPEGRHDLVLYAVLHAA